MVHPFGRRMPSPDSRFQIPDSSEWLGGLWKGDQLIKSLWVGRPPASTGVHKALNLAMVLVQVFANVRRCPPSWLSLWLSATCLLSVSDQRFRKGGRHAQTQNGFRRG